MRRLLLLPPLLVLALAFAWPLVPILASQSTEAWSWALHSPYVRGRMGTALLQAFLSTLLALFVAAPLAWLFHRRDLPRRWLTLHAAPFVLPVFVIVFGLQATLGNHSLLHAATGLDLLAWLGPLGAVALANAYYNYGVAARILHATLERRPGRLEEVARTLGASPRQAFLRASLPLLRTGFLSAALLVFLFSFASFGVILYLGQGQVGTFETLLYESMAGAFARMDRAAVLAVLQLCASTLLLSLFLLLQRRGWPAGPPSAAWAGGWRWGAPFLAAMALTPLVAVLLSAFRLDGHWSLEAWRALLDPDHPAHLAGFSLGHAVLTSLLYAAAASAAALGLTLCLWAGSRSRGWAEGLASLPLGSSSLVLGLGLALAYGPGRADLRGTYTLVLAAHVLVALPFVARTLLPALGGIDARLSESAAVLGASAWQRLARIQLPLVRPALGVALGTAAALSLGDFGASLLLMAPGTMGLTVWIARHGGPASFDPLHRAESVALAALLLALTGVVYAAASWRPGRHA
ncbi:MAG TPA: ABC transporter permease subunit [Candidatus Thermoplasmatota archaeon]|nr:ABC transporter permease subunit [Candidatus Thermoplasmatota archaeon]